MREREIEQYLKARVEKAGGLCLKFTSSVAGVPDRIVVYKGAIWFVEVKNEHGLISPIQYYQIDQLRHAGALVRVVRSKANVDLFMDDLLG